MAKSPTAFRTISEVSDWLDTPAHVLRFWESKFTQIKPVKRAGGRRYYRPDDIQLIAGIKFLLHEKGMTIKGVQKVLREEGTASVAERVPPVTPAPEPTERRKPIAKVVQLRPHSDADHPQSSSSPTAPPDTSAPASEPQGLATSPTTPSPNASESQDMQFSLFEDDPVISDDPDDSDSFASARILGSLVQADKAALARRSKILATHLRRLETIQTASGI